MDSSEPALNFLGRTESTSTGEIGASIFSLPTSVRGMAGLRTCYEAVRWPVVPLQAAKIFVFWGLRWESDQCSKPGTHGSGLDSECFKQGLNQ